VFTFKPVNSGDGAIAQVEEHVWHGGQEVNAPGGEIQGEEGLFIGEVDGAAVLDEALGSVPVCAGEGQVKVPAIALWRENLRIIRVAQDDGNCGVVVEVVQVGPQRDELRQVFAEERRGVLPAVDAVEGEALVGNRRLPRRRGLRTRERIPSRASKCRL